MAETIECSSSTLRRSTNPGGSIPRTLIEHIRSLRHVTGRRRSIKGPLTAAIEVQSHLNLTQLGRRSLQDAVKIVELAQATVASETAAARVSLSSTIRSFMRESESIGFAIGAANVGLDAYELDHITQKAVYSTQLAFDSASLLVSSGSAGESMLGEYELCLETELAKLTDALDCGEAITMVGMRPRGAIPVDDSERCAPQDVALAVRLGDDLIFIIIDADNQDPHEALKRHIQPLD
ncbi:TcdA/TcdB pore forming domain-containing protein [Trichoderma pleuroticola]